MGEFDYTQQQSQVPQPQPTQQMPPQAQQVPQQQPIAAAPAAKPSTSGLAITSLVLGLLAILTSFLPIINNGSFFLALLGLILAIVGFMGIRKGKHSGKGIAIAGIVLCALSIVIVLATQAAFSSALDKASEELQSGSTPVAASTSSEDATEQQPAAEPAAAPEPEPTPAPEPEPDYSNLAPGQTVTLKSGLAVTVNSITGGIVNYNDEELVCVNVTYVNGNDENESFNPYDWKAEDANGAQRSQTFYMDGEDELHSGDLSAGGTVTGNIYFEAPITKVHFYGNIFDKSSTAAWVVQ